MYTSPSIACLMSALVGSGLFLRSVYMDITIPGLQNPHCVPWLAARRSCKIEREQCMSYYVPCLAARCSWNPCGSNQPFPYFHGIPITIVLFPQIRNRDITCIMSSLWERGIEKKLMCWRTIILNLNYKPNIFKSCYQVAHQMVWPSSVGKESLF